MTSEIIIGTVACDNAHTIVRYAMILSTSGWFGNQLKCLIGVKCSITIKAWSRCQFIHTLLQVQQHTALFSLEQQVDRRDFVMSLSSCWPLLVLLSWFPLLYSWDDCQNIWILSDRLHHVGSMNH